MRLISLEGGEGAGKSTQLDALAAHLEALGEAVVQTREPGGSDGAEAIRRLLVEGSHERWSATSELFLFLAARQDHLERVIRPALARGAWVITDRYWDSTRVYQGLVGRLGLGDLDNLHERWLAPFRPGLTLLFDLPAEIGLARAHPGRFEAKGADFHARVRAGFLQLARAEPARFTVIDAQADLATVKARAKAALDTYRQHLAR
ncbi:MAG: dTMP kinase [Geminicoccaceae bacterium]|nr:MAG: dTMP kinase [Geminicoccaceae bacterium]